MEDQPPAQHERPEDDQRPPEFPEEVPHEPDVHQQPLGGPDARDQRPHGSRPTSAPPARAAALFRSPRTSPKLRSRIATISSICSAVTISGGPKAIQWGSNRQSKPWANARRPTWTPKATESGNRSLVARSRTNS